MAEYIEREAVINRLKQSIDWCENELENGEFKRGCIASLRDEIGNLSHNKTIPNADVAEVRRGRWIWLESEVPYCRCSLCGHKAYFEQNFCPNCGADMRGVTDA